MTGVCKFVALIAVLGTIVACDFLVTQERPAYVDLEPYEKDAVTVVIEELTSFNTEVERLTDFTISDVVDRERINVSFDGIIFAANLGDNIVHVAVWDNLSDIQKQLVKIWFKSADLDEAAETYKTFFYRFMAVSQGVKQYMYEALTVQWVFGHRSVFNVERDSARIAMSHYAEVGRRDMWTFTEQACEPIIEQYDATYGPTYGKRYLNDHFAELIGEGKTPTGYMYYLCRWIAQGQQEAFDLANELLWLSELATPMDE